MCVRQIANQRRFTLSIVHVFLELRLKNGQTIDEGRIELYSNGKWLPVCNNKHENSKTITEYCQGMGYADGIRIEDRLINKNVTKCQNGSDLHIRCTAQSM